MRTVISYGDKVGEGNTGWRRKREKETRAREERAVVRELHGASGEVSLFFMY